MTHSMGAEHQLRLIGIRKKRGLSDKGSFDHDKGQKSALSGRLSPLDFLNFLQWIFFPLLHVYCVI